MNHELTRNNMNVCHNIWQGEAKRVLTVCSAGCLRSPTAAVVLQREFGHNTRAAGIEARYAIVPVTDVLLYWAEEIVVMNGWMGEEILSRLDKLGLDRNILSLEIEDCYAYMEKDLQQAILERYKVVLAQFEEEADT